MNGLIELQVEVAKIWPHDNTATPVKSPVSLLPILQSNDGDILKACQQKTVADNVIKHGLANALGWAAAEIRNTLRAAQGASSAATASHRPVSGMAPAMAYPHSMRRLSIQSQTAHVATPSHNPPSADQAKLDQPSTIRDRVHVTSLPPIIPPDEMKRGQHYEQSMPGSAQSPQTSSSSSIYGTGQSPMQSLSIGRSLPSPPGTQFNHAGLPPSSHSHSSASQAHLDNLQHQVSTKALALTTLQREHDQLLAAFSRSQIRCSTLDKKSQVSDHEINTLTEEKIRLQQQVDALETQVEELSQARDNVQRQSTADGAQWRQIMAMSSQLQMKSADDAKRHKAAKEAWDQEREGLERRIQQLEDRSSTETRLKDVAQRSPSKGGSDEDAVDSNSVTAMRVEILRLRTRLTALESVLREVTGETEQIDRAMKAMVNIRARITGQIGESGAGGNG